MAVLLDVRLFSPARTGTTMSRKSQRHCEKGHPLWKTILHGGGYLVTVHLAMYAAGREHFQGDYSHTRGSRQRLRLLYASLAVRHSWPQNRSVRSTACLSP